MTEPKQVEIDKAVDDYLENRIDGYECYSDGIPKILHDAMWHDAVQIRDAWVKSYFEKYADEAEAPLRYNKQVHYVFLRMFARLFAEIEEQRLELARWGRGLSKQIPHDAGVWKGGQEYSPGSMVTFAGSAWICKRATDSAKPGTAEGAEFWRLFVKRGSDGKDAR